MRIFLLFQGEMALMYLTHFCSVMKIRCLITYRRQCVRLKCLSQDTPKLQGSPPTSLALREGVSGVCKNL